MAYTARLLALIAFGDFVNLIVHCQFCNRISRPRVNAVIFQSKSEVLRTSQSEGLVYAWNTRKETRISFSAPQISCSYRFFLTAIAAVSRNASITVTSRC